ncbi:hypothetical protein TWF718_009143 [Orbilia javanica]|uniref:Uncharacterized protein n=1 Tax=Orbilia javanica TaxID=47235 RepID=A0AAN8MLS5_9PEZI
MTQDIGTTGGVAIGIAVLFTVVLCGYISYATKPDAANGVKVTGPRSWPLAKVLVERLSRFVAAVLLGVLFGIGCLAVTKEEDHPLAATIATIFWVIALISYLLPLAPLFKKALIFGPLLWQYVSR